MLVLFLVVLFQLNSATWANGISTGDLGNFFDRAYGVYDSMPKTEKELLDNGWFGNDPFDNNLGQRWTETEDGPTYKLPISIYTGKNEQVCGFGVDIYGTVPANYIGNYFLEIEDQKQYHISLSFRSPGAIQSNFPPVLTLGDRLIVNQGTFDHSLPVTEADAIEAKWIKGACFGAMGYHYFQDTATPGHHTWKGNNLLPVSVMFWESKLNAFFFASMDMQQTVFPPSSNQWEPVPLANPFMCANFCDRNCGWSDTSAWSTLHVFTQNYKNAVCPDCMTQIGCCYDDDEQTLVQEGITSRRTRM